MSICLAQLPNISDGPRARRVVASSQPLRGKQGDSPLEELFLTCTARLISTVFAKYRFTEVYKLVQTGELQETLA